MNLRIFAVAVACSFALAGPAAAQRPEADLCIVPPGAQPSLPAKLLPGMGTTDMPVTTTSEEARKLFDQAADMEAALIYTEPPSYPRPVVEGWATTAIALGEPAVAEQAYRTALAREPGSGRADFGIAVALRAQNKLTDAQAMEIKGREAWNKADTDLPQLRQATSAAAR